MISDERIYKNEKIVPNLYKRGNNNYRILIKRKNDLNEEVNIKLNIEAASDKDAILYLNNIYRENNISINARKTSAMKGKRVDKYIYKYGKDYYRIRITNSKLFPDGFSEYYNEDLRVVKEIRDRLIAERKMRNSPILKLRNLTLEQFFNDEYISKYCAGFSPKTVEKSESIYKLYVSNKFGKYKLCELENMTSDLHLFVNGLKTNKKIKLTKEDIDNNDIYISGRYQHDIYSLLNNVFNIAIMFKGIASNPMDGVKPPKFKSKKTNIYKTKEVFDILDLLTKYPIRERFIISLFICSGLRRGELVGLHIDDFDFEKNCIYVRRNAIYDRKNKKIIEKDPKTFNGIRTIYLPQFVMDYANLWFIEREQQIEKLTEREMRLRKKEYIAPDNVFLSRFGDIIAPDTPGKLWGKFRNKEGLNHVTTHGLRATFATIQYHDNKHLTERELAVILGHAKDLKMTKHYSQENEDLLPESAYLFDKYAENRGYDKRTESEIDNNYISFDQLATILTRNIYCSTESIVELVNKYYELNNDLDYSELPKYLFKMRNDLLSSDEIYDDIENYIKNSSNEWHMIQEGKAKYGDKFAIGIYKNKRLKHDNENYIEDNPEFEL